jgi:hypothetical protein
MNAPDLFYQNYSVLGGTVFGEAYTAIWCMGFIYCHADYLITAWDTLWNL